MKPRMFYFGPWDRAGHYLFKEGGRSASFEEECELPFGHWRKGQIPIDGRLQPRGPKNYYGDGPEMPQGIAALHHEGGWTALSFWDRSVDERGACNSTYLAEGTFTFDEMVTMAKERFAYRWNKMKFEVTATLAGPGNKEPSPLASSKDLPTDTSSPQGGRD